MVSLKRNKVDAIILVISILLIVFIFVATNAITKNINSGIKYVSISIDGKERYKYPLSEDKTITLKKSDYPTLLDDMVIEIKDNKVRVKEEESPRHYCSRQGYVSNPAIPIVCLPNSVVITIIGGGDNDVDEVIYNG